MLLTGIAGFCSTLVIFYCFVCVPWYKPADCVFSLQGILPLSWLRMYRCCMHCLLSAFCISYFFIFYYFLFFIILYIAVCFVCFCLILYITYSFFVFMYSYCNVYVFLFLCMFYSVYSVSLCFSPYCFTCKCVLYYCHRLPTQLQLTYILSYRHIIPYHIVSYLIISYII
jgi:hypothetical protein